jgi:hypothetical protein
MKYAHLTFVLLATALAAGAASAAVTITPTAEDRHIFVQAFAADGGGSVTNSDRKDATPGAPFSMSTSRTANRPLSTASAFASQSSSIMTTSIGGTGSATASTDAFDEFAFSNGRGESICDVTFTIGCDADYHLTGTSTAQAFHDCSSAVTLYSGTTTVIHHFDAGATGPGGPFDVSGSLVAGTYRIRAECIALAGAYGQTDNGFSDFDFTFTISEQSAVGEDPASAPGVILFQNRPNPFRALTIIPVSLSRPARVSLRVFDASGRAVATLVDGDLAAGVHEVAWQASGVGRGVYFYRLEADGAEVTRRLVVRD